MALRSRTLLCNHRRPPFVTPPWNSVPINHRLPFPSSPALGDHHATLRLFEFFYSRYFTGMEWNRTVFALLHLAYSALHNVLKVHLRP